MLNACILNVENYFHNLRDFEVMKNTCISSAKVTDVLCHTDGIC